MRGTDFGKSLARERWRENEFETLRRLWWAGADVPYPISLESGLLMEYVGTEERAASRLIDVRLSPDAAAAVYASVLRNVRLFLDNRYFRRYGVCRDAAELLAELKAGWCL